MAGLRKLVEEPVQPIEMRIKLRMREEDGQKFIRAWLAFAAILRDKYLNTKIIVEIEKPEEREE